MASVQPIRIGTRASALARWQANWVAQQLRRHGAGVELVPITTRGDLQRHEPIAQITTTGVFTKELQRGLIEGRIDLAVHSLKDLPTDEVPGLVLAAVPERESVRDVLVSREKNTLAELPPGALVGTGSVRRRAQLLHARADLRVADIRGNVETRLQKLHDGAFDAIVLAEAGLKRLALAAEISEILPLEVMLPAVGQGALGIEARRDDDATRRVLAAVDDREAHAAVVAERALLAALRGGCLAPVAAWCRPEAFGQLTLTAAVFSSDGRRRLVSEHRGGANEAALLGQRVAAELLAAGAADLIDEARRPTN